MSETVLSVPRSKTPAVLAGAVTVALVLGLGAYFGYRLVFGGAQPADRMPASAISYASIDLTPDVDQTRRLLQLVNSFPEGKDTPDLKTAIEKLLGDLDLEGLDPKRDITSWLGMRVAVGAWSGPGDQPFGLLAAASTDDRAATAGLTRVRDSANGKMGFVVRDGYALIAMGDKNAQAAAESADAQARSAPLSREAKFVAARDWLRDEQLAMVYVDLAGMGKLAESAMTDGLGMSGTEFEVPPTQGQMVAGARLEDGAVVVRSRTFGAQAGTPKSSFDAVAKLGAMSGNSDIAAVVTVPEDFEKSAVTALMPLMLGSLASPILGGNPGGLSEAESRELDALMAKGPNGLTAAEQERLDELMAKMFGPGPGQSPPDLTAAEQKELNGLLAKGDLTEEEERRMLELLGLGGVDPIDPGFVAPTFDNLFEALAGGDVSLSAVGLAEQPFVRVIARLAAVPSDAAVAELRELIPNATVVRQDKILTVGAEDFPGRGWLSERRQFQDAFAGAPKDAQFALYANFMSMSKKASGPFQAIGLTMGTEQGDQVIVARILFG